VIEAVTPTPAVDDNTDPADAECDAIEAGGIQTGAINMQTGEVSMGADTGNVNGGGYKCSYEQKRKSNLDNMLRSMTTSAMATDASRELAATISASDPRDAYTKIAEFTNAESTPIKLQKSLQQTLRLFKENDDFCRNKAAMIAERTDALVALQGEAQVHVDDLKNRAVDIVRLCNSLSSNQTQQHTTALELREQVGVETDVQTLERLEVMSMDHKTVRETLNHRQLKSWGTPMRLKDRLLRSMRNTLLPGDRAGEPEQETEDSAPTEDELEADGVLQETSKKEAEQLRRKNEEEAEAKKQQLQAERMAVKDKAAKARADKKAAAAEAKAAAKAIVDAAKAQAKATMEEYKTLSMPKATTKAKAKAKAALVTAAAVAPQVAAEVAAAQAEAMAQAAPQVAVAAPAEAMAQAVMPPGMAAASAELSAALQPLAPAPDGLTVSMIDTLLTNNDLIIKDGKRLSGAVRDGYLKKQRAEALKNHKA